MCRCQRRKTWIFHIPMCPHGLSGPYIHTGCHHGLGGRGTLPSGPERGGRRRAHLGSRLHAVVEGRARGWCEAPARDACDEVGGCGRTS